MPQSIKEIQARCHKTIAEKNERERKNRNAPLNFHGKLQQHWQIQTSAQTMNAASHKSQTVKLFSSFSVSFGQPNLHAAIHQGNTSPMS
jgi:hypothetical protein